MAAGLPVCGPGELLLPQTVHITPSRSNAWRDVRDPESRYTRQQLYGLKVCGLDAAQVPEVIVRQSATKSEFWWPSGTKPPVYLIPCPIVGDRHSRGARQLLVITPDGSRKFVREDGSILGGKKWSK